MINIRLSQAKVQTNDKCGILSSLGLVIIMGDFYQFSLLTKIFWYISLVIEEEIYDKSI